ncbi:aspartate/glutamate racemase family protein [Alkalibacillus aidingensis]|uniref:aspartate/glutamate racemase family protein n=1 Tax=Alkalibacillus aidingensis TaxID=2747607 RepID=UPI0016609F44|nr:amino acid racemase [Alkalibacillus aidingensis]
MKRKKIGVLGGMGSQATSVYFNRVVEQTEVKNDQDHIDMIILNHASLPDRTEVILTNREETFLEPIKKDIQLLTDANVDYIAMTCNTAHYFFDLLQATTSVPMINMVEETLKLIEQHYGRGSKVGILATDGTIVCHTYQNMCERYGMIPHAPNETIQQQTMDLIYRVKADEEVDAGQLETIIHHLMVEEKCDCVILACTELSCINIGSTFNKHTIDAMDALVGSTIRLAGGKLKSSVLPYEKIK